MLVLAIVAARESAAQGVAPRLAGRVSPEVVAFVDSLAFAAAARGLPVDPIVQKAIEGGAKGVAADLIRTAVQTVAAQLDQSADALRTAGLAVPDTDAIAAGAFALNAGLSAKEIASLAKAGARQYGAAVTLRVAGTIAALGVPGAQTVELVRRTIRAGRPLGELLALPGRVQAEVLRGVPPAQAAQGLARGAGRGQSTTPGGPPPWARGQPRKP
jgi:hypothetical protein